MKKINLRSKDSLENRGKSTKKNSEESFKRNISSSKISNVLSYSPKYTKLSDKTE